MKFLRKILSISTLVITPTLSMAQGSASLLRKAEAAYNDREYYTAIQYYLQLNNDSAAGAGAPVYPFATRNTAYKVAKDIDVYALSAERLGESYRKIYDYDNAVKWYARTLALKADQADPNTTYWYAYSLRASGNYDEALIQFKKFKERNAGDVTLLTAVTKEIENCEYAIEEIKHPKPRAAEYLNSAELNLDQTSSYASFFELNDTNSFYFTTSRFKRGGSKKDDQPYLNKIALYYSGGPVLPVNFYNINNTMDMGAPSLTGVGMIGSKMYFTMWEATSETDYKIYYSYKLNDTAWSDPIDLGEFVNMPGTKSQQPYVTIDGSKLYFASNRPGGFGGFDIYVVDLDLDGKPKAVPRNLGAAINTAGDDVSPFFEEVSGSLVYSSNGRVGLGGLDLYKSKLTGNEFGKAENLGYPINSWADDAYPSVTADSSLGYLSSDRRAGCCYELFKFKVGRLFSFGRVVSMGNKPIDSVKIKITDSLGNVVFDSMLTNANGKYYYRDLRMNTYYKVTAYHPDFVGGASASFNTYNITNIDDSIQVPDMVMISKVAPLVLENIFYDYDKADLRPESFVELDKLADVLKKYPEIVIELSSHTDSKGSDKYNMDLSYRRAQSCVNYLISKGVSRESLVAKGYGETQPRVPNTFPDGKDNPANRQLNRRTEFKVLKEGKVVLKSDGKPTIIK